jgi:hypothetical protein
MYRVACLFRASRRVLVMASWGMGNTDPIGLRRLSCRASHS